MNLLLTIVIPVHNRAQLVVRTLDSLAASTCRRFHLIVVDNGSTDDSLAVCRRWAEAQRDGGLQVDVLSEPRPGAAVARNTGLSAVATPYVYFFDSDDLFDAHFVEVAVRLLSELTESLDVLCMPVTQEVDGHAATRAYVPSADAAAHVQNSMLSTQTMLFRTAWLRGIGGWNEQLSIWQDWELGLRVLLAHPRLRWFTERSFHRIQIHADSITGSSFSARTASIHAAMQAALADVQSASALTPSERQRVLRALYYRARIMAGKFAAERNPEGRALMRSMAAQYLPQASWLLRTAAGLLETYTAHGGRGAWRLALWLQHG